MTQYTVAPKITHPDLTGIDIAVWFGLSSFAHWIFVNGAPAMSTMCYPSLRSLGNLVRFSMATICRSLKKLEKLGYIKRLKGNRHNSTRYILISEAFIGREDEIMAENKLENKLENKAENKAENKPENTEYSHTENTVFSQGETNNINNIKQKKQNAEFINTKNSKNKIKIKINTFAAQRMASRKPIFNAPYDKKAFKVLTDMYYVCLNYEPDVPSEIRLLQDLAQEYPNINLFREFRKAMDWLEERDLEARTPNLRRFLRHWVSNANTKNIIQMNRQRY